MAFDIYGERLERGHCEVHPHVHEEYPCSVCISSKRQKERQKSDEYYKQQLENYIVELRNALTAANARIKELEVKEPAWVPVSEGLPEPTDPRRVLVYTDNEDPVVTIRLIAADLFARTCTDAVAWKYIEPPITSGGAE